MHDPALKKDIFRAVANGFAKSKGDWREFSWLWQNQTREASNDQFCDQERKKSA